MFALWSSLNHIPIKYRDLIKETSHLRSIYLTPNPPKVGMPKSNIELFFSRHLHLCGMGTKKICVQNKLDFTCWKQIRLYMMTMLCSIVNMIGGPIWSFNEHEIIKFDND